MSAITKVLEEAIQEVRNLPEPDQESIGRQLLSHVERLRRLRVEIDRCQDFISQLLVSSPDAKGDSRANIDCRR